MDINLNFGTDGDDTLLLMNDFDLFMQEVELAIKVIEGTIWNRPNGLDINSYVFNKYISTYAMRTEIVSFIARECEHANSFQWDVKVQILRQNDEELILITMTVNKGGNDVRTNKFIIS